MIFSKFRHQAVYASLGGAAEACGIVPGDRLITIDGVNVANSFHDDVIAFLKTCNRVLLIAYVTLLCSRMRLCTAAVASIPGAEIVFGLQDGEPLEEPQVDVASSNMSRHRTYVVWSLFPQ